MKLSLLGVEVEAVAWRWTVTRGSLEAYIRDRGCREVDWHLRLCGSAPGSAIAWGTAPGKAAAQRAVNEAAHAYLEGEAELREWHRSRNSPGSAYYKSPRNQAQRAEGR